MMKAIKKIINYINNKDFKIIFINNSVNVVNYSKILEIKSDIITIENNDRLVFIKGNDLKLNKLLDNEILITGIISKIEL